MQLTIGHERSNYGIGFQTYLTAAIGGSVRSTNIAESAMQQVSTQLTQHLGIYPLADITLVVICHLLTPQSVYVKAPIMGAI